MKYINKFETENDVRTAIDNDELLKPYVAYVEDGDYIDWDTHFVDYSRRYLTFKILSGGDIVWKTDNPSITKTISYSFDNGKTWTEIESTEEGVEIPVVPGDKVIFKGTNASYGDGTLDVGYGRFKGTSCDCIAEGNIMSLAYGDDFIDKYDLTENSAFANLFRNTNIIDARNLILPATGLTPYCYFRMFGGITKLLHAPNLPATELKNDCYRQMFGSCYALETAPELPATVMKTRCYMHMFLECHNLLVTPKLPATELAESCYSSMFSRCTGLERAPELPAETLVSNCYQKMFNGCTNLKHITCLAVNKTANSTSQWVVGVDSPGTFVKQPSASWTKSESGVPINFEIVNSDVY